MRHDRRGIDSDPTAMRSDPMRIDSDRSAISPERMTIDSEATAMSPEPTTVDSDPRAMRSERTGVDSGLTATRSGRRPTADRTVTRRPQPMDRASSTETTSTCGKHGDFVRMTASRPARLHEADPRRNFGRGSDMARLMK